LVITATETARHDVAQAYRVPEGKIRVVPLAPADVFRRELRSGEAAEIVTRFLGSDRPYLLFLGKLTARRNAPLLVEAFAELKRRSDLPESLLVVGLNTTGVDLPALAAHHGIADSFRYVDHVSDDDLGPLVACAKAFVMPYAYEALSLTALEAQAAGTAVVTVDAPGLREQTGGHALFVERAALEELVDGMKRILDDEGLRARLEREGREHAEQFTWERCSLETLDALSEAASS
jgi:glycosyltransferase involved in cell wall biosynthesis